MNTRVCKFALSITCCVAFAVASSPAGATLVNVATPGNVLALLPDADVAVSSLNGYGLTKSQVDDNFINTASQDNGQVFANADMDQRLAITGFNSSIGDIRFFSSPTDPIRFPSILTVYYSQLSTTSLDPTNSAYTGLNGGTLLPTSTLNGAAFTPVPNSTSAYIDLSVFAPAGTQTLLVDVGPANGAGDRIAELQAFAVPEPTSVVMLGIGLLGLGLVTHRRKAG